MGATRLMGIFQPKRESRAVGQRATAPRRGRRFVAALTALMLALPVMSGALGFSTLAFADDLENTVPNNEVSDDNFYSNTINTGFVPNGYGSAAQYGPSFGPHTVNGVVQSQSLTSATSFAAGLPLGTIFIDQSKISQDGGTTEVVSKDTSIIAGLVRIDDTNKMGYDGTRNGATKMVPGKINELKGDLFAVTFKDAAVLPNGNRANLVITYSNAQIVIDQRYAAAPDGKKYYELTGTSISSSPANPQPSGLADAHRTRNYNGKDYPVYTDGTKEYILPDNEQYYHGAVFLAQGNALSYGGTDLTNFSPTSAQLGQGVVAPSWAGAAQTLVDGYVKASYPGNTFANSNQRYPTVGLTMDATYQIMNEDGTPVAGTYVFAVCGINLDRDPDLGEGNNRAKPLWYSYDTDFGRTDEEAGKDGKKHSFFSEAMEITGGQASQYVYVRPNNALEDNSTKVTGLRGQYFYPNVSRTNNGTGNIKFIGNSTNTPSLSGHDNSYSAGVCNAC